MRDDDLIQILELLIYIPIKEHIGFVILVDIILIVTDVLLQKILKII